VALTIGCEELQRCARLCGVNLRVAALVVGDDVHTRARECDSVASQHPAEPAVAVEEQRWELALAQGLVLSGFAAGRGCSDTADAVLMRRWRTLPTTASVDDDIASRASAQQALDCRALIACCERVTGEPPRMWGPSIVGHGVYRYTYASRHGGEMPLVGFAIRGRDLVVYVSAESEAQRTRLVELSPHGMGKSCLYLRRLADLDVGVLEAIVADSVAAVRARYG
jgi:hypothetical protein